MTLMVSRLGNYYYLTQNYYYLTLSAGSCKSQRTKHAGGCESRCTKRSREELPRFRGQWQPGAATTCLRSGAAARRRQPVSEVRGGREKPPRARGQGQ